MTGQLLTDGLPPSGRGELGLLCIAENAKCRLQMGLTRSRCRSPRRADLANANASLSRRGTGIALHKRLTKFVRVIHDVFYHS